MRATPALLALLVALPLASLSPPAAAAIVHAPQSSLDGSALFVFSQVDTGSIATVQVAGKTYQRTVTDSSFSVLVPKLPDGFQRWWANVTLGNATWRDTGYIAVDTSLARVALQLGDLRREVTTLQNRSATLAGSSAGVQQNLTKVQQGVRQLDAAMASNRTQPQAAAVRPGPVGLDLASRSVLLLLGIVAACVLLLGLNFALVLQMRRRSRDSMVFLLALAGHEGVTAESPEFQKALAALHAKAKGKAPKPAKDA